MTRPGLPRRIVLGAQLALVFLRELWLSSVSVARAAFAPVPQTNSAIVAVPIRLEHDLSIAVLANLVTLTPGTCTLHVSADRRTLFVHALDCEDGGAIAADIQRVFAGPLQRIEGSAP